LRMNGQKHLNVSWAAAAFASLLSEYKRVISVYTRV
jgi:hypothetical protein